MSGFHKLIPIVVAYALAVACTTTTGPDPAIEGAESVLALEAEGFRLVEAEIVRDPAASGGRAVKIMTTRSFCSTEFTLPEGEYLVKIRVKAIDQDHDQFYLTVGTKTVQIQPTVYNTYAYCDQSIMFSLSAPTKGLSLIHISEPTRPY